ncbi:DUF4919 domain-containing protein [Nocardioides sp. SR21]|uniref:DUF4919 domain-containing protein n=1 Tax=Nocardioides sp. SR21 TaxID=2919501 RepID=UPI001FAAB407|nr:DUF4919 domain-containing protein [Nocardioides sp. SR21]
MTTAGDLVGRYLADPTPASLADVRRAVRADPSFDPGLVVGEADGLAALQRLMPGALLSPSAHGALADALARAGRQQAAARERLIARAALAGILATGDGSRERPWSVLRVSDEYDVLRSQRRRSTEQTLERDGSRHLDRHVCDDGSEAWFDVTELFSPD